MEKLILILTVFGLMSCKKIPGNQIVPQTQVTSTLKLGDTVRWLSPLNPTPNDKMVIKAVYYNDPAKPLTITVLDGTVYYTDSATQFIIWK